MKTKRTGFRLTPRNRKRHFKNPHEEIQYYKEQLTDIVRTYGSELVFKTLAVYEDMKDKGTLCSVPCKIGDSVWSIKSYKGKLHPTKGVVSEMFFTHEMKLMIVVKHVRRGFWGQDIFATEAEAVIEIENRDEHDSRV